MFLKGFQTDAPMVPYLGTKMYELVLGLMGRFIKPEILEEVSSYQGLTNIKPKDKDNQVSQAQVDIGFAARNSLRVVAESFNIDKKKVVSFRKDCISMLAGMTDKLLEKCPLKYDIVRHLSATTPENIISDSSEVNTSFQKFLQTLVTSEWRSADECDEILTSFKTFRTEMRTEHREEFKNNSKEAGERLDTFFGMYMNNTTYVKLWEVFKLIFTLSHGQASVERGYSVNNDLLVENMKEKTVTSLRTVYDSVSASGKHFTSIPLNEDLKRNVKSARMRYETYKESLISNKAENDKNLKRKNLQADLKVEETKRRRLKESIDSLSKEADELAKLAEKKQDLTFLSKSNAFRQKVTDKMEEESNVQKKIDHLKSELQSV